MKICAISDMHGKYDFTFKIEPCDLLLICGDIVPLDIQGNLDSSLEWVNDFFIPWCKDLPCDKVIFIAGNHDKVMKIRTTEIKDLLKGQDKVVYLECETYVYKGYVIYGTPICKIFGRWSFMEPQDMQMKRYERHLKNIDRIDIIMSHDTPYGISDVVLQADCPWGDGTHIGNQALRFFVDAAQPKLMFHGHIHSSNHECEMCGETEVYNVSLLDEKYELAYEPLYIEIDDR